MKDSENKLEDLLANDSFLRWVNSKADRREEKKWQEWLGVEKEGREKIVKKAKKLVNMPFEDYEENVSLFKELRDLKKRLRKS